LTARAPVARIVAGDAWDDLRPARPIDFVGRDDVIQEVLAFIAQVRDGGPRHAHSRYRAPVAGGRAPWY
jgi:hypothetical protein